MICNVLLHLKVLKKKKKNKKNRANMKKAVLAHVLITSGFNFLKIILYKCYELDVSVLALLLYILDQLY